MQISLSNQPELRALTGLRAFFAFWVIVLHIHVGLELHRIPHEIPNWLNTFIRNGFWGVDGFFILSGFILSYQYFDKFSQKITFTAFKKFLQHRLARIYPVHFVMLGLYACAILLGAGIEQKNCGSVLIPIECDRFSMSFLLQQLLLVASWGWNPPVSWNLVAWSISSEWFAYLLFPFMCLLIPWFRSKKDFLILWFFLFFLMFLIFYFTGLYPFGLDPDGGLVRVFFLFASGCVLFQFYKRGWFESIVNSQKFSFVILVFFIPVLYELWYLIPILISFLILHLAKVKQGISVFFSHRIMVYIGKISYSWYMVHVFVFEILGLLIPKSSVISEKMSILTFIGVFTGMLFLSLAFASLLFHFVEEPLRKKIVSVRD